MEKKYFKPEIKDLHIGYECEACFGSFAGIFKWDQDGVTQIEPEDKEKAKNWTKFYLIEKEGLFTANNHRNLETAIMLLKDNRLRTPYLTKEQIEAEEWEDVIDIETRINIEPAYHIGATFKNAMLGYNVKDHSLAITFKDPTKSIDGIKDEYDYPFTKWGQFRGECKSINEFRKILQYLQIK